MRKRNQIRIIAGEWRSRVLTVVDSKGLRPTTDRVRETLFNWLQFEIHGAHCLDLFAGTGGLGFESLSRGAKSVDFVEPVSAVAKTIEDNIVSLQAQSIADVHCMSAAAFLAKQTSMKYDLVFLDPPYQSQLLQPAIDQLSSGDWLNRSASVYVEQERGGSLNFPDGWFLYREGKAGQSHYAVYRVG